MLTDVAQLILDGITVWQNQVTILTSDEDCQGIISEFEAIIIPGSNQNINSISWDLDLSIPGFNTIWY